jgi:dinuclear metal center YbgI/SA1388 family protein
MAQIKDIAEHLESIAPPVLQESYDNSGLLLGDASREVTKILVCLDSTEAVIDEAITKGCNLVVAHHPIIWGGLKRINGKNETERVVIKAIKNDIAVYACHTNLDKVASGVNKKFAERLQLKNTSILKPETGLLRKLVTFVPKDALEMVRTAICEAGAGAIGNYDSCTFQTEGTGTFRGNSDANPFVGQKGELHREPEFRLETIFPSNLQPKILKALLAAHPYEEVAYDIYPLENANQQIGYGMIGELPREMTVSDFLGFVKIQLHTEAIRYVNTRPDRLIRNVAVCGGVGHFMLRQAIGAGADAYITADVKYHEIMEAENHLLYADIGHYESEKHTMELFIELISQKFPNIALLFSELNINPVHYFTS